MKKRLKTLALLVIAFTVGEFVTMWRLDRSSPSLKTFTKKYFGDQKEELQAANKAAELLYEDPKRGVAELKKLAFPYRPE